MVAYSTQIGFVTFKPKGAFILLQLHSPFGAFLLAFAGPLTANCATGNADFVTTSVNKTGAEESEICGAQLDYNLASEFLGSNDIIYFQNSDRYHSIMERYVLNASGCRTSLESTSIRTMREIEGSPDSIEYPHAKLQSLKCDFPGVSELERKVCKYFYPHQSGKKMITFSFETMFVDNRGALILGSEFTRIREQGFSSDPIFQSDFNGGGKKKDFTSTTFCHERRALCVTFHHYLPKIYRCDNGSASCYSYMDRRDTIYGIELSVGEIEGA